MSGSVRGNILLNAEVSTEYLLWISRMILERPACQVEIVVFDSMFSQSVGSRTLKKLPTSTE